MKQEFPVTESEGVPLTRADAPAPIAESLPDPVPFVAPAPLQNVPPSEEQMAWLLEHPGYVRISHAVMGRFHAPDDEKRSLVIVPPVYRDDWLHTTAEEAGNFMTAMPPEEFTAAPAPKPPKAKNESAK